MKDLGLFQAYYESGKLCSLCKRGSEALQGCFRMDNQGRVIGKEEVMDQLLMGLCVGLQPSDVEQATVKTIANIYSVFIIQVFCGLHWHH